MRAHDCDVLVIGGGPAGATAAALLAERGRSVVMLEKSRHPRFHIGESLLPLNLPLFERLGVADQMRAIGMPKYGAEFNSPWHPHPVTFEFSDAMDKSFPLAYQVRRSEFDEILFRNAVARGAIAVEECRVVGVDFSEAGATVKARHGDGSDQTWRARFVIDASGRDTFLANHFATKQKNPKHNSASIFGHFRDASRLPGKAEGNISLFWFDHGWFWFIPLADGVTSVGAVCWPYYMKSRNCEPRQFFFDTIALCPPLAGRLQAATLISEVTATGNYSYASTRAAGTHYIMLGDAYAFIDPVLSTGVLFAMQGAFVGVEAVEICLNRPQAAPRALKAFGAAVRRGPNIFSWFIYRMTAPALRNLFMEPRNAKLQEAVLSVLAGDIFRGTPLGWRLLRFKLVYYVFTIFNIRTAVSAWKKRRTAIHSPAQ